jgi:hypothetical protein
MARQRAFTDADVRNPEIAAQIGEVIEKAYEEARNANICLDSCVELALEFICDNGEAVWGYYFADHDTRTIFWYEDYESGSMNLIRGVHRKDHISKFFSWNAFL